MPRNQNRPEGRIARVRTRSASDNVHAVLRLRNACLIALLAASSAPARAQDAAPAEAPSPPAEPPRTTAAQDAAPAEPPPPTAAQEKARAHYDDGVAAFRAGNFAAARDLFERAYMLDPAPVLLFNLGRANAELGDAEKAIEYFTLYLDREPQATDRDEVERLIRTMRAIAERREREAEPAPVPASAPASEGRVVANFAPPPSLRPWAWTAFGVGAAGLGAGIWFGLAAIDAEQAHNASTSPARLASTKEDAERSALLSNVGYGVAAVGAAAGLTLWLLEPTGTAAAVAPAPGGGVVTWGGRF